MTEDEAKTKMCGGPPAAAAAAYYRAGATVDAPMRCIGSACMAWRGRPNAGFEARAERAFRIEGRRLKPEPHDVDGFCGLAGAPQ